MRLIGISLSHLTFTKKKKSGLYVTFISYIANVKRSQARRETGMSKGIAAHRLCVALRA